MATDKQIAANRQNAKLSTGPRTQLGKRRSRRNALRHGLSAETLIAVLEDRASYRSLQRAICADYCPHSKFEIELVNRLVSLLWRLRRASAIESGLLSNQAIASRRHDCERASKGLEVIYRLLSSPPQTIQPNARAESAHSSIADAFLNHMR